jgi:AbiV family abortive infection protein
MILSHADADAGAFLAAENATELFKSAIRLNEYGARGSATALLVLCAEESSKSLHLASLFKPLEQAAQTARVFSSHKAKHDLGAAAAALLHAMSRDFKKLSAPPPPEATRDVSCFIRAWKSEANLLKQRGFYVDRQAEQWVGPKQVTPEEFPRARFIAETLLAAVRECMPAPKRKARRSRAREL